MRRVLVLLAFLVLSFVSTVQAAAIKFNENMNTDPFTWREGKPRRWCVRYHGASWDQALSGVWLWKDTDATARVTNNGCCGYVSSPACEDSGTAGGRFLMRTVAPYKGTDRQVQVWFGIPANWSNADTLEVYSAVHPHCNAGVKVTLSSPTGNGSYQLKLSVVDQASTVTGATECAYNGGINVSGVPATSVFTLSADAGNSARYSLLIRSRVYPGDPTKIAFRTRLYDGNSTPTNAKIVETVVPKPAWYGRHANFFAIGGVRNSAAKIPVTRIKLKASK